MAWICLRNCARHETAPIVDTHAPPFRKGQALRVTEPIENISPLVEMAITLQQRRLFRHLPLAVGSTTLVCHPKYAFWHTGNVDFNVANGEVYSGVRCPLLLSLLQLVCCIKKQQLCGSRLTRWILWPQQRSVPSTAHAES